MLLHREGHTHIYLLGFSRHYRSLRSTGRYFRRYTATLKWMWLMPLLWEASL